MYTICRKHGCIKLLPTSTETQLTSVPKAAEAAMSNQGPLQLHGSFQRNYLQRAQFMSQSHAALLLV